MSALPCTSFHCRWFLVFQETGGADVLVFVMNVYEFGNECPKPNRGYVYIALIDSVRHVQPPRCVRERERSLFCTTQPMLVP